MIYSLTKQVYADALVQIHAISWAIDRSMSRNLSLPLKMLEEERFWWKIIDCYEHIHGMRGKK